MATYDKLKLNDTGFFDNYQDLNFIPLMGLMIKKICDDRDITMDLAYRPQSYYNQMLRGIDFSKGVGFRTEPIKSYHGTTHFDDGDMYDDIKYKEALKSLIKLMNKNKALNELDMLSKSAIIHLFNEIDRNVRNHSGIMDNDFKHYYYSMVVYPEKRKLQFVIADEGQGFERSLNSENAVSLSVGRGITAKSNHSEVIDGGRNSGYGLYLAHSLAKKKHDLEIVDNFKYYIIQEDGMKKVNDLTFEQPTTPFTIIAITIDIDTIAEDMSKVDIDTDSKSAKSKLIVLDEEKVKKAFESPSTKWGIFKNND